MCGARSSGQARGLRVRFANACLHPSLAGLVVLAGSLYPIPSRTRPLNSPAPMVLSLKTWKSRSLPGLPRTENLFTIVFALANMKAAAGNRGGFCFCVDASDVVHERHVRCGGRRGGQLPVSQIVSSLRRNALGFSISSRLAIRRAARTCSAWRLSIAGIRRERQCASGWRGAVSRRATADPGACRAGRAAVALRRATSCRNAAKAGPPVPSDSGE